MEVHGFLEKYEAEQATFSEDDFEKTEGYTLYYSFGTEFYTKVLSEAILGLVNINGSTTGVMPKGELVD
ncbi:hypothetical protein GP486_008855 [Trichoglossum hirsutum]|uniref:Uncharacterized protein n=1 Tax=Trichoglossum hirsutum TaxID=265104 RepID=A0A9P8I1T6_9PEZI|nr:hypothetical protein GP486_008855 [Trichoglossum hirsutum]